MHKKIEAELVSLVHSVLQMKNKEAIVELHKKAQLIYEKLTVLKYLDEQEVAIENESISTDKNSIDTEVEFKEQLERKLSQDIDNEINTNKNNIDFDEEYYSISEEETFSINTNLEEKSLLQTSLEEEFKEAISASEASEIFENITKENPIISDEVTTPKRILNDTLFKNNLQIGLNDRIAFVKHLFDGSQEDFNRVVSQLNTFNTENEAKKFISKFVKPDYDWKDKQEFEERLLTLIERKFN